MLEPDHSLGKSPADLPRFLLEELGPGRVVVDELDRLAVHHDLLQPRRLELGLTLRRHRGQLARTGSNSRDQSLYAMRGESVFSGVEAP